MKELIQRFFYRVPFFRILVSFVFGISCQFLFAFPSYFFFVFFSVGFLFFLPDILIKKSEKLYHYRWCFGVGVLFVFFAFGGFVLFNIDKKNKPLFEEKESLYHCKITHMYKERPASVGCEIKILKNIDDNIEANAKAIVHFQKDSFSTSLRQGNELLISCHFKITPPSTNPFSFDYANYLKKKGIVLSAYVADNKWKKIADGDEDIFYLAQKVQRKLLNIYLENGFKGDEFSVLAALTLGYKEALEKDLQDDFSAAGATHILAVSGLHVGVIFLIINFLLSFLDKTNRTRFIKLLLVVFSLWFYAFITGLPPSVMRAAFMLTLVSVGGFFNKNSQTYNNVFFSAFVLLLFNPYLLFDLGFQLSYLAVLSILFFQPKFYALLQFKNKFVDTVWSLFSVSVSAQLGTLPLVLYYFHQFPNYFWFSNLMVVPLSGILIYLAVSLLLLHWIPLLNILISYCLLQGLKLMNYIVSFIHDMPFSVTENIWLEKSQMFLLFLIIIGFSIGVFYRKFNMLILGFVAFILVLLVNIRIHYQTMSSNNFIVADLKKSYAISFVSQNKSYVLTNDSIAEQKAMQNYRLRNKIESVMFLKEETPWFKKDGYVFFAGKKVMVLSNNIFKKKIAPTPFFVDYLVLTNKTYVEMSELLSFVLPQKIIIDGSYSMSKTQEIELFCQQRGIDCYSIKRNGAYLETF